MLFWRDMSVKIYTKNTKKKVNTDNHEEYLSAKRYD